MNRISFVIFPYTFAMFLLLSTTGLHADLVSNGDFEAGNSGFSSQYAFKPAGNTGVADPSNNGAGHGEYDVRQDPENWNTFYASTDDHTSGAGNMLVVNGAITSNLFFWQQAVSVASETEYEFSAWLSTALTGGPGVILIDVNGSNVAQFSSPGDAGTWEKWTTPWFSGAAATADIRMSVDNFNANVNDFYVDDIGFRAVPVPEPSSFLAAGLIFAITLIGRRVRAN